MTVDHIFSFENIFLSPTRQHHAISTRAPASEITEAFAIYIGETHFKIGELD